MEQTYAVPVEFGQEAGGFAILGGCIGLVIWLVIFILVALIFCKIFSKAGYHWAMGLLALIPVFGLLIAILVLTFGQWPIHRELQALKHTQMAPPPEDQPHESFRGN